MMATITNKDN